jgi:hypothetical protein
MREWHCVKEYLNRGKWSLFNGQLSFVIFGWRLRRGIFKKKLREAPPPMTNDN